LFEPQQLNNWKGVSLEVLGFRMAGSAEGGKNIAEVKKNDFSLLIK